jgi:hypothetical protein
VLSQQTSQTPPGRSAFNSRPINALQPLTVSWLSFSDSHPLFSITCSFFLQNTGGGVLRSVCGLSTGVDEDSRCRRCNTGHRGGGVLDTSAPPLPLPSHAPCGASIPCGLTQLRILPVTTGVLLAPAVALCASASQRYTCLFSVCRPLFSHTYKTVGGQLLSFHIHTKPRGMPLNPPIFSVRQLSDTILSLCLRRQSATAQPNRPAGSQSKNERCDRDA